MPKATGVVQHVKSEWKKSQKTGKDFQVHSVKMGDVWYNCGFNDTGVFEGDNVEIIYSVGKYGCDVEKGAITRITGAVPAGKADVQAPATGGTVGKSTVYVDTRQESIHFQSSRKDAIAVADIALKYDLLKLPTAQNKKLDVVTAFIDHMTNQYVADVSALKTGTGTVVQDAPDMSEDD